MSNNFSPFNFYFHTFFVRFSEIFFHTSPLLFSFYVQFCSTVRCALLCVHYDVIINPRPVAHLILFNRKTNLTLRDAEHPTRWRSSHKDRGLTIIIIISMNLSIYIHTYIYIYLSLAWNFQIAAIFPYFLTILYKKTVKNAFKKRNPEVTVVYYDVIERAIVISSHGCLYDDVIVT